MSNATYNDQTAMNDMEADVVILGAGLAGHCAAIEAARAGASVILLEKMDRIGGSTVLSGGSFAFAGTDMQKSQGIDDSDALLSEDLNTAAAREAARGLIDVYVSKQREAYEFLLGFGVKFNPVQFAAGQSVPRSHPTDPGTVIELLASALKQQHGIEAITFARALRLERDDTHGRVTAVRAEKDGSAFVVRARKGVILATGGFSQSRELMTLLAAKLEPSVLTGSPGNVGDGLKMAWALGGGLADVEALVPTFGSLHADVQPEPNTIVLAYYRGGIAVNRSGRRFINESRTYKEVGAACLDEEGAMGFQIFDQKVMDASVRSPRTLDFTLAKAKGRVIEAPTINELARKIGVDADTLCTTVDRYNQDIRETGADRLFGRATLVHKVGKPFPLDHAPYYAYPTSTYMATTYAGLTIDTGMRVIDVFGEPIEGLYAAGEIVGGVHGRGYMTGAALGKAVIFGRIAGHDVATL